MLRKNKEDEKGYHVDHKMMHRVILLRFLYLFVICVLPMILYTRIEEAYCDVDSNQY